MQHACAGSCASPDEAPTTLIETLAESPLPQGLADELGATLPAAALKLGEVYRSVYARDGSYFEYVPLAVVRAASVSQVQALIGIAARHRVPLTFRAGGTSLSGQTVGTGLVVDLRQAWKKFLLRDDNNVWFEPGLTVEQLNRFIAFAGRKIGPDPASSRAAMMGGVLSNNSSGMQAGVEFNSYHTIVSIEFVLANGHRYDSGKPEDRARFAREDAALHAGLAALRDEVRSDPELVARIRHKYSIKNVTGYSINALVDFDEPIDILTHLLIGAEGTLAFIASAVLKTLPLDPFNSSTLLFFHTVPDAAAAVPAIAASGADAIELMDLPSLRSALGQPGVPDDVIKALPGGAAALLVDYQAETAAALKAELDAAGRLISSFNLVKAMPFSTTAQEHTDLWAVRNGIFASVAGARVAGSTVILEDIAAPVERLHELVGGLQGLFEKYGYHGSIFGHAKAGNMHFLITDDMSRAERVQHFGLLMEDLVTLVLSLDGSLKAEHGTGRAVAPFVAREWGEHAYSVMKRIKTLLDPDGLFNPGVLINDDAKVHLEHLKSMDVIGDELVDRCIECGFCEHVCPTRYVTLTPRQRIQSHRARLALEKAGEHGRAAALWHEYGYEGRDTCVTDGMCQTVCPVGINTASLTDADRAAEAPASARYLAVSAARHFHLVEAAARAAIDAGTALDAVAGSAAMPWVTKVAAELFPGFPQWSKQMRRAPAPVVSEVPQPDFIYFPACVSRILGAGPAGKDDLVPTVLRVAERAGIALSLPPDVAGLCCSQPWEHKGFEEGRVIMANRIVEAMWRWSDEGRIPIMCETTSCVRTLVSELKETSWGERRPILSAENAARHAKLRILDIAEWLHDAALPRLETDQRKSAVVIHPTCACHEMKLEGKILAVAQACSETATIPEGWGCCGAGGDRGFLHPEITESACRDEAESLQGQSAAGAYSFARTCELVLSDRLPFAYESLVYLVDETTRKKPA